MWIAHVLTSTHPLTRAIAAAGSPIPPSFDGSTIRFQLALFSLMSLSIVALMTWIWMTVEAWRGRTDAFPWEPLFALRGIFWLCSFQAMIRCGPEAAWMISYRESSPGFMVTLQTIKRWLDAFAIVPGLAWMATLWIFYPAICSQLALMARQQPYALRVSREKATRLGAAIALTFIISALIAIGKQQ